jgi:zinc transporter, ZIP family
MLLQLLLFALIPALAIFFGGVLATVRIPGKKTQSLVQHMAAGLVFAALVGEVLPEMTSKHPSPIMITGGFALGVALMLLMRWFIEGRVKPGEIVAENPTTLILVIGVDILIDGFLIGIGIGLGQVQGILLTVALGIEIFFLGLSTGVGMIEAGTNRRRILTTLLLLAIPPILGVFTGGFLYSIITEAVMTVVLSFAAAALLYLVTEELLVEAHEVPETPFSTAAFFVGFLVLYLLEIVLA